MSVYVDPLFGTEWADPAKWRFKQSCHMTADSPDELHAFATQLGLKRAWAQHVGRPTLHYDLTASKRTQAVRLGAKEVTMEEAAKRLKALMRGEP